MVSKIMYLSALTDLRKKGRPRSLSVIIMQKITSALTTKGYEVR